MRKEVGAECVAVIAKLMEQDDGMGMFLQWKALNPRCSRHDKGLTAYEVTAGKNLFAGFKASKWRGQAGENEVPARVQESGDPYC